MNCELNRIASCLLSCVVCMSLQASPRDTISLNRGWTFHDRIVDLPHDFQTEQPWVAPAADEKADNSDAAANVRSRLSARAFKEMGRETYTRELRPDKSWREKRVMLDFEGIMLTGDVYLNGEHIGGTDYGYLGFDIDITSRLKWGETNIIKVIADTGKPENSRWYTGGGLYRNVRLIITDAATYFPRHPLAITTTTNGGDATIDIRSEIFCATKPQHLMVGVRLTDGDGNTVATRTDTLPFNPRWRDREYSLKPLHVASPRLWSCEDPYLYTAEVTLYDAQGNVADRVSSRFGIRDIDFSPEHGLRLNGKKVLLKGIANHHTLGALGAAAYPRAIEERIALLKEFGFNHIRTSHNPYSEDFLNLCDQYGILVVDELYDKWLQQYAGGRVAWETLWQHDVPEFVKRDRNHPSVVMWSLGNELQGYANLPFNDWGVTAYRLQRELLRRYDTTRPVTVAMHPRVRSLDTDSLPAPLALETDIASYNYRYMYFPGDAKRFPNMIFYQSEANLSNMGPNFFDMDLEKVVGLAYWGMIDYLGESNGWPAKGWQQGVFDTTLRPKPMAYFLRSFFKPDEPIVHIGVVGKKGEDIAWNGINIGSETLTESWNHAEGDTLSVWTYTNGEEVELMLNGRSLGKKSNDTADSRKRNRISWTVPYEKGVLEAVSYTKGKPVARHKIQTHGQFWGLKIERSPLSHCSGEFRLAPEANSRRSVYACAKQRSLPIQGGLVGHTHDSVCKGRRARLSLPACPTDTYGAQDDLLYLRITAIDSNGNTVLSATDDVTVSVTGDATIMAMDNGDINSDEPFVTNHRKLHEGSCIVILRTGTKGGNVEIIDER